MGVNKNLSYQNTMNKDYLAATFRDIVTSVDPFASSQEDGEQFVGSLLDLVNAARGLDDVAYADFVDSIQAAYKK